ncbi:MAG: hypothetical protein O2954_20625, partial [bacterium]|nr:hypothetical protein [bacterium]
MFRRHRFVLGFVISLATIWGASGTEARPWRPAQLPNGIVNNCATCHVSDAGGGPRNAFGQVVGSEFLSGGNVVWNAALARLDSDGDGATNGQELGDPDGDGTPTPGAQVTNPGDPSSKPAQQQQPPAGGPPKLTLKLTGMTPHVGQLLVVRVVDRATGQEVGRKRIESVVGPGFDVVVEGLKVGGSYDVDFYADLNKNGKYDAPPADHAWRMPANNVQADVTLNFAHNTNFTDIKFPADQPPAGGALQVVSFTVDGTELKAGEKNPPVSAGMHELVIKFSAPLNLEEDEDGDLNPNNVEVEVFPNIDEHVEEDGFSDDKMSAFATVNLPANTTYQFLVVTNPEQENEVIREYYFGTIALSDATVAGRVDRPADMAAAKMEDGVVVLLKQDP